MLWHSDIDEEDRSLSMFNLHDLSILHWPVLFMILFMPKPISHILWSIKYFVINAPKQFGSFYCEPIKQKKWMESGKGYIASGSLMIREVVQDWEHNPKKGCENQGREGEHEKPPHFVPW